jgi:hypothetical protein
LKRPGVAPDHGPPADGPEGRLEENTPMLFGFGPEDLQRFAVPIGVGIAILLILIVPSFRRTIIDSYKKGKEARERLGGKKPPEEADKEEGTSGR